MRDAPSNVRDMLLFRSTFIGGPSERAALRHSFWSACDQLQCPRQAVSVCGAATTAGTGIKPCQPPVENMTTVNQITERLLAWASSVALPASHALGKPKIEENPAVVDEAVQMLWIYAVRIWRYTSDGNMRGTPEPKQFHAHVTRLVAECSASAWLAGIALIMYHGNGDNATLICKAACSCGLSSDSWRKLAALAEVSCHEHSLLPAEPSLYRSVGTLGKGCRAQSLHDRGLEVFGACACVQH
jgi:hypothetical protein